MRTGPYQDEINRALLALGAAVVGMAAVTCAIYVAYRRFQSKRDKPVGYPAK